MANYRDSIVASFSVDRERHQQDKNEWNCDRVHFFVVRISTAGADGTKFDVNLFRVESIHPSFYNCGLVRNGCRLRTCYLLLVCRIIFPLQYFRDTYTTKLLFYIQFSIERQTGSLEKFNDFSTY